jgi:hypothetical protein
MTPMYAILTALQSVTPTLLMKPSLRELGWQSTGGSDCRSEVTVCRGRKGRENAASHGGELDQRSGRGPNAARAVAPRRRGAAAPRCRPQFRLGVADGADRGAAAFVHVHAQGAARRADEAGAPTSASAPSEGRLPETAAGRRAVITTPPRVTPASVMARMTAPL